uniref:t-SNARE coiled-coil homology domain-containing protein n=1 Tax=Chrysotila carterae TaxID=13221 RepID=A0A7S4EYQ5_CHRCT|mmetsp:Transcript_22917/g.50116  ORF Transcript_22917/g.50116 Transcript_22917/m.50116 type:complete len:250 (-) Transcript_22917:763-1512(-)
MDDPWEDLEAEVNRQLAGVGSGVTRWRVQKSVSEKASLKSSLLRMLTELDVDLQDMAATVEIATKDPAKFNLNAAELQRRREFVHTSQAQALEVRAELTEGEESGVAPKSRAANERHNLLSGGKASARGASSAAEPRPRQAASHLLNESLVQEQQMAQQSAIEQQDEQLGVLSGVMDRLGRMGRTINEELRAQGRALDEFTAEVDETQGRMRGAMQVMNKMLKNKENGKFCAILVLSIILIILLFLVFS